jgi:hypothetical protein
MRKPSDLNLALTSNSDGSVTVLIFRTTRSRVRAEADHPGRRESVFYLEDRERTLDSPTNENHDIADAVRG